MSSVETGCMTESAMWIEIARLLDELPQYHLAHRKGEMEGMENRTVYSVQLNIVRHSAWVAGYGWPDYEAPFVTGPNGTGAAQLLATLRDLHAELEHLSAPDCSYCQDDPNRCPSTCDGGGPE